MKYTLSTGCAAIQAGLKDSPMVQSLVVECAEE